MRYDVTKTQQISIVRVREVDSAGEGFSAYSGSSLSRARVRGYVQFVRSLDGMDEGSFGYVETRRRDDSSR